MTMDSIVVSQRKWLRNLQDLTNKPILIQRHEKNTWHDWRDDIPSLPYRTRALLPCEICFDPDVRDWQIMKAGMDKLKNFHDGEDIPYVLAYTGGKAVHLHVFFRTNIELPEKLIMGLKKCQSALDVGKEVRLFLANWLLDSAGVNAEVIFLDYGKISWSSISKGSMIRIIGSLRENGDYKTMIEAIPEQKPYKLPLRFPEKLELWDIAPLRDRIVEHLEKCLEQGKQNENERLRNELLHIMRAGLFRKNKLCTGLQRAGAGVSEGIRDNVAAGLIYACKKWLKVDQEQCREFMHQWAGRCAPAFESEIIDYKIRRIYSVQQLYSPCGFFMEAGLCEGSNCSVMRSKGAA